nr:hypothetical protein [candidate division Zixibacteria bacterium]
MKSGKTWQNRFWDHIIRDIDDLNRHMDYIHINPVKHGYVKTPGEWPHSSFKIYFEDAYYPKDWDLSEIIFEKGDFGE